MRVSNALRAKEVIDFSHRYAQLAGSFAAVIKEATRRGIWNGCDTDATCGVKGVTRSSQLEPLKSLKEPKPLKYLKELAPLRR
jgi:hypothetical protein